MKRKSYEGIQISYYGTHDEDAVLLHKCENILKFQFLGEKAKRMGRSKLSNTNSLRAIPLDDHLSL